MRGFVAPLALVMILGMVAVVTIGIAARGRELEDTGRLKAAACARWAAESGIARIEGDLLSWKEPAGAYGTIPMDGWTAKYGASFKKEGRDYQIVARGRCEDGRGDLGRVEIHTTVRRGPNELDRLSWSEGPSTVP